MARKKLERGKLTDRERETESKFVRKRESSEKREGVSTSWKEEQRETKRD